MNWGLSSPGSPPRFPSRAGDAGRGRGRGGEGRERGRRGEREKPAAARRLFVCSGTWNKRGNSDELSLLPSPPDARPGISLSQLCRRDFLRCQATQKCPSASQTATRGMSLKSATKWRRRYNYYYQHLESVVRCVDLRHTALFLLDLSISEHYGSTSATSSHSWMKSYQTCSFGVT